MTKRYTQANDMATTANNWQTPGASDPGRYKGRGEGGNLDSAYKKGTTPSGVAAVVASTVGLRFLRSHLPPPAAKQVQLR